MATLVKEDGTGLSTANSYASAADGDLYHEKHSYASAWTAATTGNKEKALMMATRLIDSCYEFNGFKKSNSQALQWPREAARDPDRRDVRLTALQNLIGPFFESDAVPQALIDATCEMAREVLVENRTDKPEGEGIKQLNIVGSIGMTFDVKDRQPIIPRLVQMMLSKFGTYIGLQTGTAKLIRV